MFLATSHSVARTYEPPEERERLLLKCPKSISGACEAVCREWKCSKCYSAIDHGFNHMFYCECGAGSAFSYSFKCSDSAHGNRFETFNRKLVVTLLPLNKIKSSSTVVSDGCLNILLLGEKGVGKSTFINAFVNYLTFESLDEALQGEIRSPIYSTFITSTEDGEEVKVSVGKPDVGENSNAAIVGESCTQSCRAYKFLAGDKAVRLIDSPGLGDTRGFDQDVRNVKDIISYISTFDVLNAVLILLRPNEEKLTVSLRYSINELLAHLHKDAVNNINFCFTNSRSSMFRPGSTFKLLKQLLSQNPQTSQLKVDKSTMYFFESEAFRYLASVKSGVSFLEEDKQDYRLSWNRSIQGSERLITRVASLSPHPIYRMVSLDSVRDLLATIEIPLASMARSVQDNIETIRKQKQDLQDHYILTKNNKQLVMSTHAYKMVPLGHLRTICKSCEAMICHECSDSETGIGIVDSKFGMRLCEVFVFRNSNNCKACGCSFKVHLRVATETIKETIRTMDKDVEKSIHERRKKEEVKELSLSRLEDRESALTKEMKQTVCAAALFTSFLQQNSVVLYHPATEEYLQDQIKKKRAQHDSSKPRDDALHRLEGSLQLYRDQIEMYESQRNVAAGSGLITYQDIHNTLQKLYALNENGKVLKANIEAVQKAYEAVAKREKVSHVVTPPSHAGGGIATKVSGVLRGLFHDAKPHIMPKNLLHSKLQEFHKTINS